MSQDQSYGGNNLEERADFLTDAEIEQWTVATPIFQDLVSKAQNRGARLFIGPRGCGKTHLFRHAHLGCNKKKIFSVYVTYGKYYHLEPLISTKANAIHIFHTWVLCKLIEGIKESIDLILNLESDIQKREFPENLDPWLTQERLQDISRFINYAEKGIVDNDESSELIIKELSITKLQQIINKTAERFNCTRTVLFLDDAALTLTPEYLVEFFEVFRNLKDRKISPKAAVYPGTTEYGSRFHLGQDAQPEDVWDVDFSSNNTVIDQLTEAERLNNFTSGIQEDVLALLKIASFGIPRAFINLVRYYVEENGNIQKRFNRAIDLHTDLLLKEYKSFQHKLPHYSSVIEVGEVQFNSIVMVLKKKNLELHSSDLKQLMIGILQETTQNDVLLTRMIRFLVEAGLLFPKGNVKHGVNRTYDRFIPHLAFLFKEKAFSGLSRGFNTSNIINYLKRQDAKHPERTTLSKLIPSSDVERLHLDLPSCQNCGTARTLESQKFCHQCGYELINESKYQQCMKMSVEELPLSQWRIGRILQTSLKTVGDIMSHGNVASELKKPYGMGRIRADDTYRTVKIYIEEFLS